jgi:hypothetical protein
MLRCFLNWAETRLEGEWAEMQYQQHAWEHAPLRVQLVVFFPVRPREGGHGGAVAIVVSTIAWIIAR